MVATDGAVLRGAAVSIKLSIDAPAPRTGAGPALYLDGIDVALLRAEVLDKNGTVAHGWADAIMFSIVSDPGAVFATVSGNSADHAPMHSSARHGCHGLAKFLEDPVQEWDCFGVERFFDCVRRRPHCEVDDDHLKKESAPHVPRAFGFGVTIEYPGHIRWILARVRVAHPFPETARRQNN